LIISQVGFRNRAVENLASATNCKFFAAASCGGSGQVPVPLSVTICGVFAALSFIVRVPATVPVPAGLNLTLILQLAPGCSEAQVVALVKLAVMVILVTVSDALPVFVRVTVFAALVVPTL
jgi:hypothetical protein